MDSAIQSKRKYPACKQDPEMMYSLATRLKARAKAIGDTWGSDSTPAREPQREAK